MRYDPAVEHPGRAGRSRSRSPRRRWRMSISNAGWYRMRVDASS